VFFGRNIQTKCPLTITTKRGFNEQMTLHLTRIRYCGYVAATRALHASGGAEFLSTWRGNVRDVWRDTGSHHAKDIAKGNSVVKKWLI